jgi:hypothetical protein
MTNLTEELKQRLADDSPHRLAYYETLLNRIASEVGGNAKFHAERTASLIAEIEDLRKYMNRLAERAEIEGLRKDMKALSARVDRMAEFLNKSKQGAKT